jgi:hypothetical protein
MQGLDGLVGRRCQGDLNELGEELPAEHAVVFQPLIAALELGYVLFSGAPPTAPDEDQGIRADRTRDRARN